MPALFSFLFIALIWQIWGTFVLPSPLPLGPHFFPRSPPFPSHTGLPFFKDITHSSASEPLHVLPANRLAPNIYITPSPFSLCSDVTFSGRMSLTTCNLPCHPPGLLIPLLCFHFSLEHYHLPTEISSTLLLDVSVFPLQECQVREDLCALNSGQHLMGLRRGCVLSENGGRRQWKHSSCPVVKDSELGL